MSCCISPSFGQKVKKGKKEEVVAPLPPKKEKPKMIICGASAYSRDWDYAKFREVADEVGAILLADISHPSPAQHRELCLQLFQDLHR